MLSSGARTPRFRISSETYKGCCKINFKSTLIGSNQDRARDLADQDSCQYVVGNGGRDAGQRTKELMKVLIPCMDSRSRQDWKWAREGSFWQRPMLCFTKVSKKWEEMNPKINDVNGNFRSVSI